MRALLVIGIAAARASLAPAPACHRARPRHHAATTPLLSTASADPLTGAQRRALRAHAGRLEAARSLRRLQVGAMPAASDALREQLAAAERARGAARPLQVHARAVQGRRAHSLGRAERLRRRDGVPGEWPFASQRAAASAKGAVRRAQVIGRTALFCRPSARALRAVLDQATPPRAHLRPDEPPAPRDADDGDGAQYDRPD